MTHAADTSSAAYQARDLITYLNDSPTPYHAVVGTADRLDAAGYTCFDEADAWETPPGTRGYVIRHGGSIIAFRMGQEAPAETGMRLIGAHTDSPGLRLAPHATRTRHNAQQLLIEPYGGILAYTWFDRDCGLAGRLRLADGRTALVDVAAPLLRVPSLAIHLNREIREKGFQPNAQQHLQPMFALADGPGYSAILDEALTAHGATHADVLTHDLMLYDVHGAYLAGADEAFVSSGRLDNLASCHAGLAALLASDAAAAPTTAVLALWDHEEVGSRTASGASGAFLRDVITRLAGTGDGIRRALSKSLLVSADMAHGVHPNYPERHDGVHMPLLGGGPVIKWNSNQSYSSDAESGAQFVEACREAGVTVQHYSHRNDLRCGTTIGPLASSELGLRTVDVGNPMLAMHSCREMCAAVDHDPMIRAMQAHLERA